MDESDDWNKRRAVLNLWLSVYSEKFPLSHEDRESFLRHESLNNVLKFSPADVYECLQKHQKLTEVETCLMSQGYSMWKRKFPPKPLAPSARYRSNRRSRKDGASSPERTRIIVNLPVFKSNRVTGKATKRSGSGGLEKGNRSSRSGASYLVNQPPVTSREDAQKATSAFDQFNRPDYF